MMNFKLIGTVALSLVLAAPAMAATVRNSELPTGYYRHSGGVTHMRAQDFDHFAFGIARPTYHSGWSGPYGDGDYPGTVDQNMGPPYWAY